MYPIQIHIPHRSGCPRSRSSWLPSSYSYCDLSLAFLRQRRYCMFLELHCPSEHADFTDCQRQQIVRHMREVSFLRSDELFQTHEHDGLAVHLACFLGPGWYVYFEEQRLTLRYLFAGYSGEQQDQKAILVMCRNDEQWSTAADCRHLTNKPFPYPSRRQCGRWQAWRCIVLDGTLKAAQVNQLCCLLYAQRSIHQAMERMSNCFGLIFYNKSFLVHTTIGQ